MHFQRVSRGGQDEALEAPLLASSAPPLQQEHPANKGARMLWHWLSCRQPGEALPVLVSSAKADLVVPMLAP